MSKVDTLEDLANLQNQSSATGALNANNAKVAAGFDNTVSRDGSAPNQMEAELDMNSNRITNLPPAGNNSEPVTLQQMNNFVAPSDLVLSASIIGQLIYPQTAGELAASITPTNYHERPGNTRRYAVSTAVVDALKSDADLVEITEGTWQVDNSAGEVAIATSNMRVQCAPDAEIEMTNDNIGLVLTGTNIVWDGGLITGEGTADTAGGARQKALLLVDGDAHTTRANVVLKNIRFTDTNAAALGLYKAVGVRVINCTAIDTNASTSNQRFGMYANDCAYVKFTGCHVEGFGTGIGGGGANSASEEIIDYRDGTTGYLSKGISIHACEVHEQADHGIYFSDYMNGCVVTNTDSQGATNNSIKLEGSNNVISNCPRLVASNGVSLRNASNTIVENCNIIVTGTGTNLYGLRAAGTTFDVDSNNITVRDCTFEATNAAGVWHGIQVYGELIDADNQRTLRNVRIESNTIKGYFCVLGTNPAAIWVRQDMASTPVRANNVVIKSNIIDLDTTTSNLNKGIRVGVQFENVVITENIVTGVTSVGIDVENVNQGQVVHNLVSASPNDDAASVGINIQAAADGITVWGNRFGQAPNNWDSANQTLAGDGFTITESTF